MFEWTKDKHHKMTLVCHNRSIMNLLNFLFLIELKIDNNNNNKKFSNEWMSKQQVSFLKFSKFFKKKSSMKRSMTNFMDNFFENFQQLIGMNSLYSCRRWLYNEWQEKKNLKIQVIFRIETNNKKNVSFTQKKKQRIWRQNGILNYSFWQTNKQTVKKRRRIKEFFFFSNCVNIDLLRFYTITTRIFIIRIRFCWILSIR